MYYISDPLTVTGAALESLTLALSDAVKASLRLVDSVLPEE